jgi:ankyrin repeat protein
VIALRLFPHPGQWPLLLAVVLPAGAMALDCPQMPRQAQQDWVAEVKIAVGKIGSAAGPELTTRTQKATSDLLGKLPRADKVYLEQMMFASYCSTVRDNPELAEAERERRVQGYVRQLRQTLAATDAPPPLADPRDVARKALERIPVDYSAASFLRTVQEGRPETVELFLRAGMDPDTADREDYSAIEIAAARGNLKIVDMLLRAKASVSGRAVSFAAMNGHLPILRLFLSAGREAAVPEDAFLAAASGAQVEALRFLAPRITNLARTASRGLIDAIHASRADDDHIEATVRELMAMGADVNVQDDKGWTPLILAANENRVRTVRTLLAAHARADTVCSCRGIFDGRYTALGLALTHSDEVGMDIATRLLDAGAAVETKTGDGLTPLMLVARSIGDERMLVALLDRGADPNVRDARGSTVLFYVIGNRFDNPASVQTLLARGAQVNVHREPDGLTPLHLAAAYGHVQTMQHLLAAGAELHARDKFGRTPLLTAVREGEPEALRLILSRGGRVSDRDQDGKTAIDFARELKPEEGRSTIMAMLKNAGAP